MARMNWRGKTARAVVDCGDEVGRDSPLLSFCPFFCSPPAQMVTIALHSSLPFPPLGGGNTRALGGMPWRSFMKSEPLPYFLRKNLEPMKKTSTRTEGPHRVTNESCLLVGIPFLADKEDIFGSLSSVLTVMSWK